VFKKRIEKERKKERKKELHKKNKKKKKITQYAQVKKERAPFFMQRFTWNS